MKYELTVISDIVITKSNKVKVVIKNDKIRKIFETEEIEVEEFIDSKTGKHIGKYSTIWKGETCYKVDKPYVELKSILQNNSIPIIGFAGKSKRWK